MIIEKESDRPALQLTDKAKNRDTKWVIILPSWGSGYAYPQYGNAGHWYGEVSEAETFDTIEDAKAHLGEYGYNAVVAFVEIETTIHYTPNKD